eukprot:Em0022g989a
MHFFIKQTRWAGVLSVPKAGSSSNGGLQIMLPLFHSPLFHFKVGTPLASKNFRSTFLSLLLSGILLSLLLQSGQVHVEAQPSPNKTLYLLSFLNYPDSATNSSDDQGIRYAIDLINSESIVPGYKLDLIEASDDCDISWNGVANLVRNLYYSDKQVIAIVGPECSSVAQVVGSLLGLPQISLINIRPSRHLIRSFESHTLPLQLWHQHSKISQRGCFCRFNRSQ